MDIIFDTNFLVSSVQWGIDIFTETERVVPGKCRYYVLTGTLVELENLINSPRASGSSKRAATQALQRIREGGFQVIPQYGDVDAALITASQVIATQDKQVKKQLTSPVLIIKQKKHYQLQNVL